jgi:hypothetical protein
VATAIDWPRLSVNASPSFAVGDGTVVGTFGGTVVVGGGVVGVVVTGAEVVEVTGVGVVVLLDVAVVVGVEVQAASTASDDTATSKPVRMRIPLSHR